MQICDTGSVLSADPKLGASSVNMEAYSASWSRNPLANTLSEAECGLLIIGPLSPFLAPVSQIRTGEGITSERCPNRLLPEFREIQSQSDKNEGAGIGREAEHYTSLEENLQSCICGYAGCLSETFGDC